MNCPLCQHPEHSVMKTEAAQQTIRRRRQCLRCGHRWTTIEGVVDVHDELARLKRALSPVAELLR